MGRAASRGRGSSYAATSRTALRAGASCHRAKQPGCRVSPRRRPSTPRCMTAGATSATPCRLPRRWSGLRPS
eukprot:6910174-Alexandrium_andersonii.AAC.1